MAKPSVRVIAALLFPRAVEAMIGSAMNRNTPRSRRKRSASATSRPKRQVNYHDLCNPFPTQDIFTADQAAAMHDTALRTLEELGIKVLLPEAVEVDGAKLEALQSFIAKRTAEGGAPPES